MNDSNLPLYPNPCCGYVTDSSADIEELDKLSMPKLGDMGICLNCGAILVYTDPKRNQTRYARRIEVETIPGKLKCQIASAQRYINKRGWLKKEAHRRNRN